MDFIPKNDLLRHHSNTLQAVRELHNLDKPGEMKAAIDMLEEWIQKQTHFVKKDFSRHRLEMMFLGAKGSIEKTKQRLDKQCTYRTVLGEYFGDLDIRKDFEELNNFTFRAALPTLTPDHFRVAIIKATGTKIGSNFVSDCIKLAIMHTEYFCTYDYNDGCVFILDGTELDLMELASKLYVTEIRKGAAIVLGAMALRLKGVHFVTSSKVIETIIKIIKQVVSEKIGNRIYSHKTIETVYDFVPQEILPVEYGGKEKSYKILHEELLKQLSSEEFRAHQKEMMNARTDESKRSKEIFHEQYLGMPGSFRTLTVD